jgi:hypothetical protein
LAQLLLGPQKGKIKRVYLSSEAASALNKMQPDKKGPRVGEAVDVKGVEDLETLLRELWPSLFAS